MMFANWASKDTRQADRIILWAVEKLAGVDRNRPILFSRVRI